jgi:4-amino-4-deoxy-L-arabinose transferase-like glycosyltransferase
VLQLVGLVLALSFALKLALVLFIGDVAPDGDERQYVVAAESIAAGEGIQYMTKRWTELHYPPLYPYLCGLSWALGAEALGVKLLQVVLSTATVWLVFLLGRRWFGDRIGLTAAGLLAFYPTLIGFSHWLMGETVFLFLLTASFVLHFGREGGVASARRFFAAGLVLGIAAMTREVVIYFIPLVLAWMLFETRDLLGTVKRGALYVGGFLLVVLPFCLHLQAKYGGFILITDGGSTILYGNYNAFPPPNYDWGFRPNEKAYRDDPLFRRFQMGGGNPVEASRIETRRAIEFALDHPVLSAERAWVRFVYFLNPTNFVVRWVRRGSYSVLPDGTERGRPPKAVEDVIVGVSVLSYVLLASLAVAGLWAASRHPGVTLALLILAAVVFIHSMVYGMSRYRVPLLPFLAIFAAQALVHRKEVLERLRSARGVGALATLLFLAYVWSLHFDKIWSTTSP